MQITNNQLSQLTAGDSSDSCTSLTNFRAISTGIFLNNTQATLSGNTITSITAPQLVDAKPSLLSCDNEISAAAVYAYNNAIAISGDTYTGVFGSSRSTCECTTAVGLSAAGIALCLDGTGSVSLGTSTIQIIRGGDGGALADGFRKRGEKRDDKSVEGGNAYGFWATSASHITLNTGVSFKNITGGNGGSNANEIAGTTSCEGGTGAVFNLDTISPTQYTPSFVQNGQDCSDLSTHLITKCGEYNTSFVYALDASLAFTNSSCLVFSGSNFTLSNPSGHTLTCTGPTCSAGVTVQGGVSGSVSGIHVIGAGIYAELANDLTVTGAIVVNSAIGLFGSVNTLELSSSTFQSTQQVGVTVQSVGAISIANNTFLTASGTAIKITPGAVNSQITISGNKVQGGQFTTEVFEIYSTNSQAIVTDNIVADFRITGTSSFSAINLTATTISFLRNTVQNVTSGCSYTTSIASFVGTVTSQYNTFSDIHPTAGLFCAYAQIVIPVIVTGGTYTSSHDTITSVVASPAGQLSIYPAYATMFSAKTAVIGVYATNAALSIDSLGLTNISALATHGCSLSCGFDYGGFSVVGLMLTDCSGLVLNLKINGLYGGHAGFISVPGAESGRATGGNATAIVGAQGVSLTTSNTAFSVVGGNGHFYPLSNPAVPVCDGGVAMQLDDPANTPFVGHSLTNGKWCSSDEVVQIPSFVTLPPGLQNIVFAVSSFAYIPPSVTFALQDARNITFSGNYMTSERAVLTCVASDVSQCSVPIFQLSNSSGIFISGMDIEGNRALTATSVNGGDLHIENVIFEQWNSTPAVLVNGSYAQITIENCAFDDLHQAVVISAPSAYLYLQQNTFTRIAQPAVEISVAAGVISQNSFSYINNVALDVQFSQHGNSTINRNTVSYVTVDWNSSPYYAIGLTCSDSSIPVVVAENTISNILAQNLPTQLYAGLYAGSCALDLSLNTISNITVSAPIGTNPLVTGAYIFSSGSVTVENLVIDTIMGTILNYVETGNLTVNVCGAIFNQTTSLSIFNSSVTKISVGDTPYCDSCSNMDGLGAAGIQTIGSTVFNLSHVAISSVRGGNAGNSFSKHTANGGNAFAIFTDTAPALVSSQSLSISDIYGGNGGDPDQAITCLGGEANGFSNNSSLDSSFDLHVGLACFTPVINCSDVTVGRAELVNITGFEITNMTIWTGSYEVVSTSESLGCGSSSAKLNSTISTQSISQNITINQSTNKTLLFSIWTSQHAVRNTSYQININSVTRTSQQISFSENFTVGVFGWRKLSLNLTSTVPLNYAIVSVVQLGEASGWMYIDQVSLKEALECGTCDTGFACQEIDCVDVNECAQNQTICGDLVCINTPGSYHCSACDLGYSLAINGTCIDIDECEVGGYCDKHVSCNNTIGNYTCGACPLGYQGDGKTLCNPLCGNDLCEANLGENCVTCPYDCLQAFCGVCGDGKCDTNLNETCSSCFADCKSSCPVPACDAATTCTGHGTCVQGACVCSGDFSGPDCAGTNQQLNVTANNSSVTLSLSPSSSFNVGLRTLQEISSNGVVSSVDAAAISFAPLTQHHAKRDLDGDLYISNSTLANGASVIIATIFFPTAGEIDFANKTTNFAAQTVKLAVMVSNWPFHSIKNSLVLVFDQQQNNSQVQSCNIASSSSDESGSLQWMIITSGSVSMYAQFQADAVLDGKNRIISYSLNKTDGSVSATIPHFWIDAVMDPSYSVIPSANHPNTCPVTLPHKSHRLRTILLAVLIPVGVLLLAGLIVFMVLRRRRDVDDRYLSKSQSSDVMLEKRDSMSSPPKPAKGRTFHYGESP